MTENETLLDLFAHPGWRLLIAEFQAMQDANQANWRHIDDANHFFIVKGRMQTLEILLHYEESVKTEYQDEADADV